MIHITSLEPQPLTKLNVTYHDQIWNDNSNDRVIEYRKKCDFSPPLKHITPETTKELWKNYNPFDVLDSESESSSSDTIIMMSSEEGEMNRTQIIQSLRNFQNEEMSRNDGILNDKPKSKGKSVSFMLDIPSYNGHKYDDDTNTDDGYGTDSRTNSNSVASPLSSSLSSLLTSDLDSSGQFSPQQSSEDTNHQYPIISKSKLYCGQRPNVVARRKQRPMDKDPQDNSVQEMLRKLTVIQEEDSVVSSESLNNGDTSSIDDKDCNKYDYGNNLINDELFDKNIGRKLPSSKNTQERRDLKGPVVERNGPSNGERVPSLANTQPHSSDPQDQRPQRQDLYNSIEVNANTNLTNGLYVLPHCGPSNCHPRRTYSQNFSAGMSKDLYRNANKSAEHLTPMHSFEPDSEQTNGIFPVPEKLTQNKRVNSFCSVNTTHERAANRPQFAKSTDIYNMCQVSQQSDLERLSRPVSYRHSFHATPSSQQQQHQRWNIPPSRLNDPQTILRARSNMFQSYPNRFMSQNDLSRGTHKTMLSSASLLERTQLPYQTVQIDDETDTKLSTLV